MGEIHTVFPPFYNFRMRQNLWPNALAKLCGAALHLLTALVPLAELGIWPAIWLDSGDEICAFLRSIFTPPGYFRLRSFLKTGNLFGLQYIMER